MCANACVHVVELKGTLERKKKTTYLYITLLCANRGVDGGHVNKKKKNLIPRESWSDMQERLVRGCNMQERLVRGCNMQERLVRGCNVQERLVHVGAMCKNDLYVGAMCKNDLYEGAMRKIDLYVGI
ncbi:hypothetical protein POVWA2_024710 [Plasmodium ovale wallikeri]|uniref:Uncharacterized protein n=1 Tax=Plasmodium ovale wallikeri TaxID=864142 RepID=A0A1A8YVA1_PLAOA|nr:hypothetical protein POVWA1_024860 [Plasmodium ovale wallikeri]SBT35374.1 hypothetical protein POVWA2_024710 [Plasmodium ovale wallikeri]